MNSKIKFVVDFLTYGFKGGPLFWAWILFLSFFIILWGYGEAVQLSNGMIVTNLNDQVSWEMYLANFVFMVGVAAAAVTVVFPAYVYKHKELHKIVVLGEMLAIAAVVMCLLFVIAHMGRPDRLWHIVCDVTGTALNNAGIKAEELAAVSATSQREGMVFLDSTGKELYAGPNIDLRAVTEGISIDTQYARDIHSITGHLPSLMFAPAKLKWFENNRPELYKRISTVLTISDWIVYKLCVYKN